MQLYLAAAITVGVVVTEATEASHLHWSWNAADNVGGGDLDDDVENNDDSEMMAKMMIKRINNSR